jgi:DDE_Tnp_1-associated
MADALSQADRAYDQVVEWLEHFEELEDPRQAGKVAYPLDEMLLQCLLAVIAGAESWVEIAAFGKKKLVFLQRFAAFAEGTPSHDQFGNLFSALAIPELLDLLTVKGAIVTMSCRRWQRSRGRAW